MKLSFKIQSFVLAGLAATLFVTDVQAWDDLGHQTVGQIAQNILNQKGNERAKAYVFDVLGAEPLSVAATFPDHVRSDERFGGGKAKYGPNDFSPYHFLNIPFGVNFDKMGPGDRHKMDAHVIIGQSPEVLIDPKASRDKKMILLRYLVHVVGDVHQPLHVGYGIDMGANLCKVNLTPPTGHAYPTNLHSVWDGKIFDQIKPEYQATHPKSSWFGYSELAEVLAPDLKALTAEQYAAIEKAPTVEWYKESHGYHVSVYKDDANSKPVVRPEDRDYCDIVDAKGKPTGRPISNIPTLDAQYMKTAVPIVKSRILKGGIRLAGMIKNIAAASNPKALKNADTDLLKSLITLMQNDGGHDETTFHE